MGLVVAAVSAISCSGDLDRPSTGSAPPRTVQVSTTASTSTAPTTVPASTVPASTLPASTLPASTVPALEVPLAGGWAPAELPAWASNPCCATPWPLDGPSPMLPAPDQVLPDGVYKVNVPSFAWSPYRPDALHVRVSRFDRCGDVAEGDIWCESGLPVDPDEIGERLDQAIEFVIPLDSSLTVGLIGTSCADGVRAWDRWIGDGESLQALWTEIDAVFDEWVRAAVWAGSDPNTVMSRLEAVGAPFTANDCVPEGQVDFVTSVSYASPSGPTLLFQVLAADGVVLSPSQLFDPVTIEARNGRLVLYLERAWKP